MLKNKNILIGITGGIAAYKIYTLIRLLIQSGAKVKVVTTPNAMNFVSKVTLQSLSNNEIYTDSFSMSDYKPEHISLVDESDVFVLAPATANTIGKIANGICDNLLTSTICAFYKPVVIAPAMNTHMWQKTFVQENIAKLKKEPNYHILEPADGFLACGARGIGRMTEIEDIYKAILVALNPKQSTDDKNTKDTSGTKDSTNDGENLKVKSNFLSGKKILVTAGGTVEKIDPVRYITNRSSGKMGMAIADCAYEMGAKVTLISTFAVEKPYKTMVAESAKKMETSVIAELQKNDAVFMAAAVSDFKVKEISKQKIKKDKNEEFTLHLVKNPDILKEISEMKTGATIVGFCAESEKLIENAKIKINNKGCDYLVANDISRSDIGFSSDMNEVHIIDKNHNITPIKKDTKGNVAQKILEKIFE